MSDTPRTNSVARDLFPDSFGGIESDVCEDGKYVESDFARQLERELAAANARIAELENHLSPKPIDERKEEA